MTSADTLAPLRSLSARLGRDIGLVQAGGGNTSLKREGVLWVKASGKWLIRAEEEEIFVPVPQTDIEAAVAAGVEYTTPQILPSGVTLRPSVETTMHAALPHRVVVHVHSVNTLAWAVRPDAAEVLTERLAGLRWVWLPYTHPGLPLAQAIRQKLQERLADVLVLGNHGLVVGAESCEAAEILLRDVELRLALPLRASPPPQVERLAWDGWSLPADTAAHLLGTDGHARRIASGGTLYPDHCVYLGPAAAVLQPGETPEEAVRRYEALWHMAPQMLLVPGAGTVVAPGLSEAAQEMLACLTLVVGRIPAGEDVTYLSQEEVFSLLNWEAEKYRQSLAR